MSESHSHHYALEHVHAIIAVRGWHDIHAQPPEPLRATTIYTVGFALVGRPEIVCVGMPHNLVSQFVGQIYHRLGHHDEYTVGVVYHDLANLPVTFGAVSDRWKEKICTVTTAYYQRFNSGKPFDAIQLIWSDKRGRFPMDRRFDPTMRRAIPLLDEKVSTA
jgi:hypothetical protein